MSDVFVGVGVDVGVVVEHCGGGTVDLWDWGGQMDFPCTCYCTS